MAETTKRVALVTGGSRGIGRAVCLELAKMGMDICVNYQGSEAAAEETAKLCRELGVQAVCMQADVSKNEDVERMFGEIKAQFGQLDVLVNNAGVTRDGLLVRMSEEDFDRVVNISLKGAYLCGKAAAAMMMRRRYGRIISISSVVGVRGNAGQCNYSAAKAGIIGLTKSVAKELAGRNITANAIAPGFIATDMTAVMSDAAKDATLAQIPMKKMGGPEDVARAVAFFAAEQSGYITGQVLCVDGGMAM